MTKSKYNPFEYAKYEVLPEDFFSEMSPTNFLHILRKVPKKVKVVKHPKIGDIITFEMISKDIIFICCNQFSYRNVRIENINGDLNDLVGKPIVSIKIEDIYKDVQIYKFANEYVSIAISLAVERKEKDVN